MSKIPRLLPLIAVAIGGVVVVRAVGIAPGLFEGAQAWAEEAVPAAAAAAVKPAAAVCALTPEQLAQQAGISPAELRILQSLQSRRTQLDARDTDLASMLPLMATAEQKLDARVQALEAVKAEVQQLLGQVSEQEKAENDRLVAVYTAMRPKEAARVFATLSDDVRLPVAAAMRPRSLAAVMAQMEPAAARELTEKLARRFAARQQLAARAATAATAATANAPAPGPVAVPTANAVPSAATATPPAPTPAVAPAPATPTPRPAVRRAPSRPTPRPATPTPTPAAAAPSGPQPYQAGEAAPAAPRQSVQ
ncbi:MotE family protein [Brevundimonas sp.]|uniref:MotE family protein n=1 Tax=Brevundimonas sp. TaxID=1871086 RepID=UPI003562930A